MDMTLDPVPLREDELLGLLSRQRKAFLADPYPSAAIRQDRIARARAALVTNKARIIAAVDADFQGRPKPLTMIADLLHPLTALKDARQKVTRWMRPEARRPEFPMGLLGVKTWVEFQPLGVVGVMSPWNAPIALTFTPLAGILAAGNRAMIKPSEFSPHVSALIAEMIASAFAPEEVAVVQGGVETAKAFAALPFDHLLYTGGAVTARHVNPPRLSGRARIFRLPQVRLWAASSPMPGRFACALTMPGCRKARSALLWRRRARPGSGCGRALLAIRT
jgi:coniferyl-aldehyde dehydrogenase